MARQSEKLPWLRHAMDEHFKQYGHLPSKEQPCLLWPWSVNGDPKDPRGQVRYNGTTAQVHRVAFLLTRGPIGAGLLICHSCDVGLCFNPYHLFEGTQVDNMQDALSKRRLRTGELAYNAKLTMENVLEIRQRIGNGERQYVLAEEFHIGRDQISRIYNRERWKHI